MRGAILFSLVLIGCGGGAAANNKLTIKNPFPTREALNDIAAAPPKPMEKRQVTSVREWTVEPRDVASPIEPHVGEIIAGGDPGLVMTPELRCVARELARFGAEHGTMPDERLRRFIVIACGGRAESVRLAWLSGGTQDGTTDEQLIAAMRGKLHLSGQTQGKPGGAWLGRGKAKTMMVVAVGEKNTAELAIDPPDASGRFLVHGDLHGPAENVFAVVNQAERGFARCDLDASVALPKFSFVCTMAKEDAVAWVEVALNPPGRVLSRSAGIGLVRRDPSAPLTYAASTRPSKPVASTGDIRAAVLEGVNTARAAAGLGALEAAPKQTAVNERLAVHFFSAELSGENDLSDKVALGLIAGWEVSGTIRSGGFFSALASGSTDAAAWLDYALESPMGRFALLEPSARQIAIGAAAPDKLGGVDALVTTYGFFGDSTPAEEAKVVLRRLAKLRAAQGLTPPAPIAGLDQLASNAKLVTTGGAEPMEALQQALSQESNRSGRTLRGWVVATNDLDAVPMPPELLAPGNVIVGIEVAHWRPEGAAWGSYVVFLLTTASQPGQVAMLDTRAAAAKRW